ncbi:Gfo/Idh/MocA family oxidoreductase [Cetobacterium sp. 2A]|uniref:Gfo/Idh/MocA family protein n=1 Tax=Cetobacterium sp. 2A TaxID=2754723 RepID=UPI00163C00DD|nr:Gfo/Idh/MocA family oxidoreductase [Cetobacterium sp. 2A]MBC2856899.1 Gfo/Idh/MocA family oxidoreductase [Cetobacterium sp. 2A]
MIRIGIIGTSKISHQFIEAVQMMEDCKIEAIYSRSLEKGKKFGEKYNIEHYYTSLDEMANSDSIDMVYIASPNSLHANQAILMMKGKKHVLCEKPLATTAKDVNRMYKASKDNGVTLMEAMKTTLTPNFFSIKKNLHKIGKIRAFTGNFCQYSSRYDDLKGGKLTNIFNPEFGGGSALDIGIYPLYFCISLFGQPNDTYSANIKLSSGVEGLGTIVLKYDDMIATVMHSKITQSFIPNEIQGELGSIVINSISNLREVSIHYLDGNIEDISIEQSENSMVYELGEFINLIENKKLESDINSFETSKKVIEILEKSRIK